MIADDRSDAEPRAPAPAAWERLADALAHALDRFDENQYLVLRVDTENPAFDAPTIPYFVQFAHQGPAGLRIEAVSRAFLDEYGELDPDRETQLDAMGWHAPTGTPEESDTPAKDPEGSPNYFREWHRPVPWFEVAEFACATLRDVYGVPHPAKLAYEAFDASGTRILIPTLELNTSPVTSRPPAEALRFGSYEDFRAAVLDTLAAITDGDELHVDEDGDIPIVRGSAVVFVRIVESPNCIHLFAPLLSDVTTTDGLVDELNQLNTRILFARLTWNGETVVARMSLFGDPFAPQHLADALQIMTELADSLDSDLQEQFGGRTFDGTFAPPKEPIFGGYL